VRVAKDNKIIAFLSKLCYINRRSR